MDERHHYSQADSEENEKSEHSVEYWGELSESLNSQETIEAVKQFPEDARNYAVGEVVQYMCLHKSSAGLVDYLKSLKNIDYSRGIHSGVVDESEEKLIDTIAVKLGLPDLESPQSKEAIYNYYAENYVKNGYYFHGFNGCFEQGIREKGLSNTERIWNPAELDEVTQIVSKTGRGEMFLGWHNINSKGKTFISADPSVSYRYSVASPEWFAQLTAEGFHVPVQGEKKQAFYYRDYELAKQNVIDACDEMMSSSEQQIAERKAYPNITQEDKEKILNLFEKYWPILAGSNSKPMLALIKREAVYDVSYPTFEELCTRIGKTVENIDVSLALSVINHSSSIDIWVEQPIPKEDILLAEMPAYEKIHPRVSEA